MMKADTKTINKLRELKKEIKEEEKIIDSLPYWGFLGNDSSPPSDDGFRAKHAQLLADKSLEYVLILENARIADVIREHEELHPPDKFDCPVCLETISMADDLDNDPIVYQCCGGANCSKCDNLGAKCSSCPLCRAELLKGPKASMNEFVKSADSGKAWAQSRLGHAYLQHRMKLPFYNPPRDKKKGLKYIKLAADQDEPTALYALGQFHHEGMNGIQKDEAKAKVFFENASNQGHSKSQIALGVLAFGRGGDEEAMKKAIHYFTLACNKDDTGQVACMFAQLYQHGRGGFEKSLLMAKHYYGEAARKGERRAYFPLAMPLMDFSLQYLNGLSLPGHNVNPLCMSWARKAVEVGESDASVYVAAWQKNMSSMCHHLKCKGKEKADGETDGKKKACSKCKSIWYCCKECQVENWKAGHKFDCVQQG